MSTKVRWGVLSTAKIAREKVIPGMQLGQLTQVTAIASRDLANAQTIAKNLGIEKAYGSYEALLADPDIDAVYIPLPNHMHVEWSIKAAEAGKHVLCEKPLSLTVAEAQQLLAVQKKTGVKIGEAFMVRTHPQWLRVKELIAQNRIGEVRAVQGFFSYTNVNPANIRNIPEFGGGALMDIGCYPIFISRLIFGEEPVRVSSTVDRDPVMKTDRLTSALLEFPSGQASFVCSTQLVPYQRMQIFGTKGRIEVEVPFNSPNDRPTRILIDDGRDIFGSGITVEAIPTCDQYTIQGDAFSQAILDNTEVSVPLEAAIKNMAVIEALFKSATSGKAETPWSEASLAAPARIQ